MCLILTKRGRYFKELDVCITTGRRHAKSLRGAQLALCHSRSGSFSQQSILTVEQASSQALHAIPTCRYHQPLSRCTAVIDIPTLTYLKSFQLEIPDISPHLNRIRHVRVGNHLGPLYIYKLPSSAPHCDPMKQCCQVVYPPIQRACLSWTWLSTAQC